MAQKIKENHLGMQMDVPPEHQQHPPEDKWKTTQTGATFAFFSLLLSIVKSPTLINSKCRYEMASKILKRYSFLVMHCPPEIFKM